MKTKYKDLFKNIGILTLSNFGSKILGFLLVPLYTLALTTEEYGNFDFINITVSLLVPLLTLNISESALRFLLDKKNNKLDVCTISFKKIMCSIFIIILFLIINNVFSIVDIINKYSVYFLLFYVATLLYLYAQNIVRGFDKLIHIAICGIINSVLMVILNLLFLLVFKLQLDGYFLAYIIANLISTAYLFIAGKIFKYIKIAKIDKKLEYELIDYGKPLMMNSVGWWINNASDRYIVTYMCGIAANGIYSVAYKIPSMLSVFQNIFNQAWGISAVKAFDKDDRDGFFKNIYSSYNLMMVICCSILIIFTKFLAKILYMNEFYSAWYYMPFLMISIVFGALSGLLGGVFSAVKDSKILGTTTIIGAIINIIFNIILVYKLGVIGAAISTAFSYFLVWLIRIFAVKKYINLNIKIKKDIFVYFLLVIQSLIIMNISNPYILYSIELIILIFIISLYKNDIFNIIAKLKNKA